MIQTNGPRRLRQLLFQPGIIRSIGAHDVFTGLVVEKSGIESAIMGGFGVSASLLGLPDLNFLTMTEMADAVRRMAARLTIPLIVDGDTGHGGLHNVRRTVEMFEAAGASAILLEDQEFPKRCGHFPGKRVIPREEMALKIKTAVRSRKNSDLVIIARTDARQVNGLDDAIERVKCYGDVGADVIFVEAPKSINELEEIPKHIKLPLLANMITGGVTPILSLRELEQIGYKIAVYAVEPLMVCARAISHLCETLQTDGRVDHMASETMTFDEIKKLLGVEEFLKTE